MTPFTIYPYLPFRHREDKMKRDCPLFYCVREQLKYYMLRKYYYYFHLYHGYDTNGVTDDGCDDAVVYDNADDGGDDDFTRISTEWHRLQY